MSSQVYATIHCYDVKADLECPYFYTQKIPKLLQSAKEHVEMLERHTSKDDIAFTVKVLPETYDELKSKLDSVGTILLKEKYDPNPFNAALKKERYSQTIIPKDPSDSRDLPWVITWDALKEEERYVKSDLNSIADSMYSLSCENNDNKYKVYGSYAHRGFVNSLFKYQNCSFMDCVRGWITTIGDKFDPDKIGSLRFFGYDDSIYKGHFYEKYAVILCEYCEKMFDISKYEVSKYFEKKDPQFFLDKLDSNDNPYLECRYFSKIAYVYAELGNYEKAIEYFTKYVGTMSTEKIKKSGYIRDINIIEQFNNYCEENGTSMLFCKDT
jgi:tetratricopeptide (TPR) repeat protein